MNDVALLKVSGSFHALPLGSSRSVKLGDSVFTIGFPNTTLQGIEPKLTKGEINSLAGMHDDPRHFQTSVALQPGNSGGPLVDRYGNVIGIVVARLNDVKTLRATGSLPQNVNYAIKSSFVGALLETFSDPLPKLKEANPGKDRDFQEAVKEVEESTVMVVVY